MAKTRQKEALIVRPDRIVRLRTQWARLQSHFKYAETLTRAASIVLKHVQGMLSELSALDITDGPLELDE